MNETDKNRVDQYFNASSAEDEPFIADSFLNDLNEAHLREIAARHWENASSKKVDLQHVLNRIHFLIHRRPAKHPAAKWRLLSVYSRIAAVLFIPLLVTSVFVLSKALHGNENSVAEIRAPKGSRIHFTLPDGTRGYLNGGSSLQYPSRFRDERSVNLTGEAYFEVTKSKRNPFRVQTEFADVVVTGTKFDVCAYHSDQEVVTTLEEGQVRVINKKMNTSSALSPGEQSRINVSSGEMSRSRVNTRLFTSWKEEMLRFDNAPFADVVKKLERWYGVRITLDKQLQHSDNYTFTLKTESLREVLKLLAMTTPMQYEIRENKVFIYSSRTKEKTK